LKRSWTVFVLWILAAAGAFGTGRELLYNLWYLLTALIVFSYLWAWTGIRWVSVDRRTHTNRSQVGKMAEEYFQVTNRGLFPKLWMEVRDHSTLPDHLASRVVDSLGRRQTRTWSVKTRCRQRGRFLLGPVSLSSGDPFGLFGMRRQLSHLRESVFIVYPATVDLPFFAPMLGPLSGGGTMRRRTHYVTTNVSSVREYAPGDSFNRIHWPSTARTGRLISKEFELDPTADVWLFLDLDRSSHVEAIWTEPEARGELLLPWERPSKLRLVPSTLEYAVTIVASLTKHFIGQDQAVGFIGYGRHREMIPADRGERQLTKILELLAVIGAEGRIPISEVLAAEGAHLGRNTTAIVVTSTNQDYWIPAAYDLNRRSVNVVSIVVESQSFGNPESNERIAAQLAASGILTYLVREGDDLVQALMIPYGQGGIPAKYQV
jgi:uncharacterized protein (DUF58 family)